MVVVQFEPGGSRLHGANAYPHPVDRVGTRLEEAARGDIARREVQDLAQDVAVPSV
jgi:hypothetical protein